ANNAPMATIAVSRAHGLEVDVFLKSSRDLPRNLRGRLQAGVGAIYPAEAVRQFDEMLAASRPDVVHVHELFPLVSPWILPRCTRRGVPVVMTVLDYRLTCPVGTHLREGRTCERCIGGREHWALLNNCRGNLVESATVSLFNAMARRFRLYAGHVSRFVAPSEFTCRWLVEKLGIEPQRVARVPCVIDIPARGVPDPAAGRYVACASRLSPEKGIDTLVEAARLSGLPFSVARNETHLVKSTLPPDIATVVTRGASDLAGFYRGARMLVFPSVYFETFGLVGAESMSHGVPVVAARIGALADLVDDGVNGLLFEPGNARDLAEKVSRLWNDAALCRRLGSAAREKAAALWAPAAHVKGLLSVYEPLRAAARRMPANEPEVAQAAE
ncbi:MAG TPA: glycosyltransferase family 4 protein, partial [Usitatibacter sp.]|nr:glycosyltransferase family 4 protein [Usitatibacter sp.]